MCDHAYEDLADSIDQRSIEININTDWGQKIDGR